MKNELEALSQLTFFPTLELLIGQSKKTVLINFYICIYVRKNNRGYRIIIIIWEIKPAGFSGIFFLNTFITNEKSKAGRQPQNPCFKLGTDVLGKINKIFPIFKRNRKKANIKKVGRTQNVFLPSHFCPKLASSKKDADSL